MAALAQYAATLFLTLFATRKLYDYYCSMASLSHSTEQPERTWTPLEPRYQPSIEDVLSVKDSLMKKFRLPREIVDPIIDFAEYWPRCTTTKSGPTTSIRAESDQNNRFLLRSHPLGFVPYAYEEQAPYQLTDQYQEKFATLVPQPWDSTKDIPNTATKEVLEKWASVSKPRGEYPCRKIVFTIVSHDQGWGGSARQDGEYAGSYTWFDAGKETFSAFREAAILEAWDLAPWPQFRLYTEDDDTKKDANRSPTLENATRLVCSLRTVTPSIVHHEENEAVDKVEGFKHDLIPNSMCLQKNPTAKRKATTHTITWSYTDNIDPESEEANTLESMGRGGETGNGEYVRNLKLGDAVTIWGKARFPGWVNVIEEMKIDVYWAV